MKILSIRSKKTWVWLLIVVLLFLTQFFNHTGFCYREMRYLSEKELLDHFIFGDEADVISEEEKKSIVEKRWNGAIYPDCCQIEEEPSWLRGSPSRFWDKTLVGQYLYQVTYHAPDPKKLGGDEDNPFRQYLSALNSCGRSVKGDSPSMSISEVAYKNALNRNSQYWKEKAN